MRTPIGAPPHAAIAWGGAALLAGVFATEFSGCPSGGGRLQIVGGRADLASVRTYLRGVGPVGGTPAEDGDGRKHRVRPPPRRLAPARTPPQPQFEFPA